MERYLIATVKSWNIANFEKLKRQCKNAKFRLITDKADLNAPFLLEYKPKYLFFPHWSWIIPEEIYKNFQCVVFHMTDLPFGRGGSPLQNLLVRGIYETKISAIRVCAGIDAGPVYLKEPLDISGGSADEILSRASDIVFTKMIPMFLSKDLEPVEQKGESVPFKRRAPDQSEIPDGLTSRQIYDYIRMLDGEGYPTAFRKYDGGKVYYRNAKYEDGVVIAAARFEEDMH